LNVARRTVLGAALALAAVALTGAPAPAQDAVKQIKLTTAQVENFLKAYKDVSAITEKLGDKEPDAKSQAALQAAVKKAGFKDYGEFEDVSGNIGLVMQGIDPQTKAFTEPPEALKKEIAAVQADKSMKAAEKKQVLDDLNAQLKTAQPVQFKENVELVKKYYDKIAAVMPQT
jgi:hypothetical protein